MFTYPALRGTTIDTRQFEDVRQAKKDLGWLHDGRHKTWLAPQAAYHVAELWVVDGMSKIANRHDWTAWIESIKGERKDR